MTCKRVAAIVALTGFSAAGPLSAQQRPVSAAPASGSSQGGALMLRGEPLVRSSHARITGVVVTMHEPPRAVPNAPVRLRTSLGKTIETVRTSHVGEFAFAVAEPGAYYVELVDDKGRVLAVEDVGATAVSVTSGQVSTTIIRVPVALVGAWVTAAQVMLAAATSSGIAGVAATGQPVSPER